MSKVYLVLFIFPRILIIYFVDNIREDGVVPNAKENAC